MAAPTVIMSCDPGVPVLTRAQGNFIAIADYCLLQRGWEKVFSEGSAKAVYRPTTGLRQFFKITNDKSAVTTYCICTIEIFDSMTDMNTTSVLLHKTYISLLQDFGTIMSFWTMIFDETGFYFLCNPYRSYNTLQSAFMPASSNQLDLFICHYFGETVPTGIFSTVPRACYAGQYSVSPINGNALGDCMSLYTLFCPTHLDGSVATSTVYTYQSAKAVVCNPKDATVFGNNVMPYDYPHNGLTIYSRHIVNGVSGATVSISGYDHLPGLFVCLHKMKDLPSFQFLEIDGRNFLIIRKVLYGNASTNAQATYLNRFGTIWIDIGPGFRSPD